MQAVYLVCYDICDPKRLRQVHKVTVDHGARLQLSVYECDLTPVQLARLKMELADIIHHREDQVLFIHLGPRSSSTLARIDSLGRPYHPPESKATVL